MIRRSVLASCFFFMVGMIAGGFWRQWKDWGPLVGFGGVIAVVAWHAVQIHFHPEDLDH